MQIVTAGLGKYVRIFPNLIIVRDSTPMRQELAKWTQNRRISADLNVDCFASRNKAFRLRSVKYNSGLFGMLKQGDG